MTICSLVGSVSEMPEGQGAILSSLVDGHITQCHVARIDGGRIPGKLGGFSFSIFPQSKVYARCLKAYSYLSTSTAAHV